MILFLIESNKYENYFNTLQLPSTSLPILSTCYIPPLELLKMNPKDFSGLIMTSSRSLECLELLQGLPLEWKDKPLYIVGSGSASKADKLGYQRVIGRETGKALDLNCHFQDLLSNTEWNNKPLLYFVGDKSRDVIPRILNEYKIPFQELCIYKTIPNREFQKEYTRVVGEYGVPQWIVFFSPSGWDAAYPILEKDLNLERIRIGSIGPTTSKHIESMGYTVDATSLRPNPTDLYHAMFSSLSQTPRA